MARYIVRFQDLVACARRVGVRVVEAPSSHRGDIGEMGTVAGVTCHYTGTRNSYSPASEYPDYTVVKEGRAGLRNSLSAFGLGRHSTIYVFSEDLSWHAGVWSWAGITDGNGHFLGIEAAGVGDWTDWQRRTYPRLVASVLLFIDAPPSMAPTHAQGAVPRGRKVDFLNGDDGGWLPDVPQAPHDFHDAIAWLMRNPNWININYRPPQEDFMATLSDAEKKRLLDDIAATRRAVERLARDMPTAENKDNSADVVEYARWANTHGFNANAKLDALTAALLPEPPATA